MTPMQNTVTKRRMNMKKINWWKVASVAMMAASAILSFGHDLIEEQRSEEEMQDMVREEVQRQLAEKNR